MSGLYGRGEDGRHRNKEFDDSRDLKHAVLDIASVDNGSNNRASSPYAQIDDRLQAIRQEDSNSQSSAQLEMRMKQEHYQLTHDQNLLQAVDNGASAALTDSITIADPQLRRAHLQSRPHQTVAPFSPEIITTSSSHSDQENADFVPLPSDDTQHASHSESIAPEERMYSDEQFATIEKELEIPTKTGEHESKILIVGSFEGQFQLGMDRIHKMGAKAGPFERVLVIGDFFGPDVSNLDLKKLIAGSVDIPYPTFFGVGQYAIPEEVINAMDGGNRVCHNLYFVGAIAHFTTQTGITIAFVGGVDDVASLDRSGKVSISLSEESLKPLQKLPTVDLLLTYEWPDDVRNYSHTSTKLDLRGSRLVQNLANKLCPKYHFAGKEGLYLEREPYESLREDAEGNTIHTFTRFIAISDFTNSRHMRWFYAFNFKPNCAGRLVDEAATPPNTKWTINPYDPFREIPLPPTKVEKKMQLEGDEPMLDITDMHPARAKKIKKSTTSGPEGFRKQYQQDQDKNLEERSQKRKELESDRSEGLRCERWLDTKHKEY